MALKGAIPVAFGDVFPAGAFATKVEMVADFDASKGGSRVQARDKMTGLPMWAVTVTDPDPDARDTSAKVKVPAATEPVLPDALPGLPFRPVEFEGLTVTPYVNSSNRLAYSFKATGLRAPSGAPVKPAAKTG
ncbi:plasmid replication, integration and excision activator [Yinghuangia sp. ASG 101]|uniref:plasmid replication, integration and excision activator n=1 Tax=Yinghuangia sp. ASG 101 TaxID=2896848 RepID=UPI001E356243|nr:plasmid replication, integration and excision activator [Yinghuangia sp. ASG 101]UGQ15131.1 plasmid replication, integration and excision activator [Yinghuangia sp. ASG 101]